MPGFALSMAAALLLALALGRHTGMATRPSGASLAAPAPLSTLLILIGIHLLRHGPHDFGEPAIGAFDLLQDFSCLSWFIPADLYRRRHGLRGLPRGLHAFLALVLLALSIPAFVPFSTGMVSFITLRRALSLLIIGMAGLSTLKIQIRSAGHPAGFHAFSRMVFFTVIVYPVAVFCDLTGFRYPGFSHDLPFWAQAYPLYGAALALILLLSPPQARAAEQKGDDSLSDREQEVIELLKLGRSYKMIAAELGVGISTVKTHTTNAYRKLGVRRRSQLFGP